MKRLIFFILYFLTIIAVGYFVLPSLWQRLWHAHTRYETMSQRYTAAQNGAVDLKQLENLQNTYEKVADNLPNAANFQAFINVILQKGRKEDLQFTRISLGKSVVKSGLNEVPVQMIFSGSYQHYLNFLKTLHDNNYYIIMNDWMITRQLPVVTTVLHPENIPDKLTFTVNAYFYYSAL